MWKWMRGVALVVAVVSGTPSCATATPLPVQKVELIADPAQTVREEADLHAQQVAAWWSRAGVVVSILGLVVSGVGLFFIWKQLRHGEEAVREAARSSQAAADAANAAILSSRPWLNVVDVKAQFHESEEPPQLVLTFDIHNIGATPALMATTHALLIQPQNQRDLDEAVRNFGSSAPESGGATIFPGEAFRTIETIDLRSAVQQTWTAALLVRYRMSGGQTNHTSGTAVAVRVRHDEFPFSGPEGEIVWNAYTGRASRLRIDAT